MAANADHRTRSASRRGSLRTGLLSGCAIAAVAVTVPARAQNAFNGAPAIATGTSGTLNNQKTYGVSGPLATGAAGTGVTEVIPVTQSNAYIRWNATNANFLPAGNTVSYEGGYGVTNFTILNDVSLSGGGAISLNGAVRSTLNPNNGDAVQGGNVWFYSPGGIIVGPTASFNVGSLLLSADAINFTSTENGYGELQSLNLFPGGADTVQFRGTSGSVSQVQVQNGATIAADGGTGSSYVALVAPRVVQNGDVTVNGSAGYLALTSADVTINAGLFDIASNANLDGSQVAAGGETTLTHGGVTGGPAATSNANPHNIYLVTIAKNDAVTMLVTGDLGYAPATAAGVVNGNVVLSGNSYTSGGSIFTPAGIGNVRVEQGTYSSPLSVRSSQGDVRVGAITGDLSLVNLNVESFRNGSTQFVATNNHTATTTGFVNLLGGFGTAASTIAQVDSGSTMTIGGNLLLQAAGFIRTSDNTAVANNTTFNVFGTAAISGSLRMLSNTSSFGLGAVSQTQGGNAILSITGGTLTVGDATNIEALATGYLSANNGGSIGGTAAIDIDGGAFVATGAVAVSADAVGGINTAGAGYGGTARVTAANNTTTRSADFRSTLTLTANGSGGDVGYGTNQATQGGNGFGGGIRSGTSGVMLESKAGGIITVAGTTTLNALGLGGVGRHGGSGGNGTGGAVTADTNTGFNGTITLAALNASASGTGGAAEAGYGAAGGNGVGGGANGSGSNGVSLYALNNGVITSTAATLTANGTGGAGGDGADYFNVPGGGVSGATGGVGGSGTGGAVRAAAERATIGFASTSSVSMSLTENVLGVGGSGGVGGDGETGYGGSGGSGGAGGASFGGSAQISSSGGVIRLATTAVDARAVGAAGGAGGIGDIAGVGGGAAAHAGGNIGIISDQSSQPTVTSLGATTLNAGTDAGALNKAGDIFVSDSSGASNALSFTSLAISARSASAASDPTLSVSAIDGPVTASGDVTIDITGNATFDFSNTGALLAGGDLDIAATGSITTTNTSSAVSVLFGTGNTSVTAASISGGSFEAQNGDLAFSGPDGIVGVTGARAGDSVFAAAANGAIEIAGIVAPGGVTATGTDVSLAGAGDLRVVDAEATAGDLALSAVGALQVDAAGTTGSFSSTSGGATTLPALNVAGGIAITAGGDVGAQALQAARSISVASTGGAITAGNTTSSGGTVRVNANGAVGIGDVTAAGSVILTGGAAITAGNLAAGVGTLLPGESSGGSGAAAAPGGIAEGFDGSLIERCDDSCDAEDPVALPFALNYFGNSYTVTYVGNNGYVTFNGAQTEFTPEGLGSDYAGLPIIAAYFADVDTRGEGSAQTAYGTGTYAGRTAFGATWNGVGYYDSHDDKLNQFQVILTDRSDTGAGNFDIYFNYAKVGWETGDADDGVNGLGGQSAAVGYNAGISGNPSGTFFELPGSRVPGSFIDGGTASLVAGSNDGTPGQYSFAVRNGQVVSGVSEPATVSVTNLAAGNTAAINVGNVSGEAVDIHGAGDVTTGNVDVGDRGTGIAASGLPFATAIQATGNLVTGTVAGTGAILLGSDTADVSTGSITSSSSVAVLAGGDVTLGAVSTGTGASDSLFVGGPGSLATDSLASYVGSNKQADFTAFAPTRVGGSIVFGGPVSTGSLIAASVGDITLGTTAVTNLLSLDTAGTARLSGQIGGPTLRIASSDIVIDTNASIGIGTDLLDFTNNGRRRMQVGGGDVSDIWSLSNDEFGRLAAHTISFNAPDIAETDDDLVIGNLDVIGSAGSGTETRRQNLTGSELIFNSDGSVLVNGALNLTGAGTEDVVAINAVDLLRVITPSGSIKLTGADGALGGTLSLVGDVVFVGSQQAADDIARLTDVSARSDRLAQKDGEENDAGYIQANGLRVSVGSGFYIQNTGPSGSAPELRAGFTVGSGGIDFSTGEDDVEVAINGRIDLGNGTVLTGADVYTALVRQNDNDFVNVVDGSTINGCIIGGSNCGTGDLPAELTQIQDILNQLTLLSSQTPDPFQFTFESPQLISFGDLTPLTLAPLIDEPVTGAGNEDFWAGIGYGNDPTGDTNIGVGNDDPRKKRKK